MLTTFGVGVGVGVGDGLGLGDGLGVAVAFGVGVLSGIGVTVVFVGLFFPAFLSAVLIPLITLTARSKMIPITKRTTSILFCLRFRFLYCKYCSRVIFAKVLVPP